MRASHREEHEGEKLRTARDPWAESCPRNHLKSATAAHPAGDSPRYPQDGVTPLFQKCEHREKRGNPPRRSWNRANEEHQPVAEQRRSTVDLNALRGFQREAAWSKRDMGRGVAAEPASQSGSMGPGNGLGRLRAERLPPTGPSAEVGPQSRA